MVYMGERLREKSGGSMRVDIYPSQQLGSERELIELLQIGSVGMAKVSAAVLESFVPTFSVFGIPYLFVDQAHRDRVLTSDVGRDLLQSTDAGADARASLVRLGHAQLLHEDASDPRSPDDLAGLKIRVQESPTAVRMVQVLGGSATPHRVGRAVHGAPAGRRRRRREQPAQLLLSRHYEVCKYYTLDEHTTVPDVLLINNDLWATLSPTAAVAAGIGRRVVRAPDGAVEGVDRGGAARASKPPAWRSSGPDIALRRSGAVRCTRSSGATR
jgi:TRAP-type C4-dicarboxylate transport system substrate-binding protein